MPVILRQTLFQATVHDIEMGYTDTKGVGSVIIYDLKCKNNHIFEGWFNDRAAFEEQKKKKLVACPVCESSNIEMVPSSITVMGKKTEELSQDNNNISPMKALQMFHEYMDKTFEDVGSKFAEVALKIHFGEEDSRNIKGTTTKSEEAILKEEGVPFVKIPIPKFNG
ncbi:MAG TPA: DUF1178 family protein [Syntrophales bacterium]|nr:DUF1178 family protein [Syntrophales bacterium]